MVLYLVAFMFVVVVVLVCSTCCPSLWLRLAIQFVLSLYRLLIQIYLFTFIQSLLLVVGTYLHIILTDAVRLVG